jgi:hypothetical protein
MTSASRCARGTPFLFGIRVDRDRRRIDPLTGMSLAHGHADACTADTREGTAASLAPYLALGASPKGPIVLSTRVGWDSANVARRWTPAVLASLFSLAAATPARAQDVKLPPIAVGAGLQTSFVHNDPDDGDATDKFVLNSVRLYVSGEATSKVKFTFNTEYDSVSNHVTVLDAVGRFEMSDKFNVWVGRMLPPSDRANLYGPYYSHHWAVYTDGVQDGYPFVATGRDNGALYWGQFGKVKVSAGAFDGQSATHNDTLITAGRIQVDFWDPEPGYYLNGTFYGDKNILAVGAAGQIQGGSDKSAYNADFLLERKVGKGGAYSIEAEYARYHALGGYDVRYAKNDGGYVLGSYLFPTPVGPGKFEILGKFAKARFREGSSLIDADYDQKTTEVNFNYVIKQFNARVMLFYKDTRFDAVRVNFKQVGVGFQVQI